MPKEIRTVLPSKMGGGPQGLGDPDDRTLRHVEIENLITKLMRIRAKDEYCVKEVDEFSNCVQDHKALFFMKCRKENSQMKACMLKWYQNKEFREECTELYLDARSEYRRTGIPTTVEEIAKKATALTQEQ